MVGYSHLHIACLAAMPTPQRTNDYTTPSLAHTSGSTFGDLFILLFGIADLTRPKLPKWNNHLVSFIKVEGLFVSYIVDIFDTIKSKMTV